MQKMAECSANAVYRRHSPAQTPTLVHGLIPLRFTLWPYGVLCCRCCGCLWQVHAMQSTFYLEQKLIAPFADALVNLTG